MKTYPINETPISYTVAESAAAYGLINFIRGGLPFDFFVGLGNRLHFSFREWARVLHLSERSLQRYQKGQKVFDSMQSERIIEIMMLSNYGKDVFGSDERWVEWLSLPNLALGGITPQSLLDSTMGIQLIKDELGRLEYGIVS